MVEQDTSRSTVHQMMGRRGLHLKFRSSNLHAIRAREQAKSKQKASHISSLRFLLLKWFLLTHSHLEGMCTFEPFLVLSGTGNVKAQKYINTGPRVGSDE